jgi:hypothetical protein
MKLEEEQTLKVRLIIQFEKCYRPAKFPKCCGQDIGVKETVKFGRQNGCAGEDQHRGL